MPWSDAAQGLLATLANMVPATVRELASAAAHDEAEGLAQERSSDEVGVDDVMRGWIRTTPPEQRNGLIAVIEQLGLDPESYVEDLENAEGWDDDTEETPQG